MYIINKEKIKNKYKCKFKTANYLMKTHGIPVLSIDKNDYYFASTEKLKMAIKEMPIFYKCLDKIFY